MNGGVVLPLPTAEGTPKAEGALGTNIGVVLPLPAALGKP
jgi:hypothetical protein